jgi:ATP-dependent DNA ligase
MVPELAVARYGSQGYVACMLYAFSLPTKADKVPGGPDWLHEIKYDGYRMKIIREQDRVRLISRGGHDWAKDSR